MLRTVWLLSMPLALDKVMIILVFFSSSLIPKSYSNPTTTSYSNCLVPTAYSLDAALVIILKYYISTCNYYKHFWISNKNYYHLSRRGMRRNAWDLWTFSFQLLYYFFLLCINLKCRKVFLTSKNLNLFLCNKLS